MIKVYEAILHGGNKRSTFLNHKKYNHKGDGLHPEYGGYKDLEDLEKFFKIERIIGIFQEITNVEYMHRRYRIFFEGTEIEQIKQT